MSKKTEIVLADLTPDVVGEWKQDQFNALLNRKPPKQWLKKHPYIKNYIYIPIDKIEYLLRKIFKRYRIELTGQGTAFNGVWVTVRVHFYNPIAQEWDYHDGIGSQELQMRGKTDEEKEAKAQVPFVPENINTGALSMAFPIAKTKAVKDACDHFGELFGANLNRKDTLLYEEDANLVDKVERRVLILLTECETEEEVMKIVDDIPEQYAHLVNERIEAIRDKD